MLGTLWKKNASGFTLASLMVSVAITALIALGAAYVIVSSQKVSSFGDIQNEIDRLQYLSLQLSRNPAFILKQPGFEKTGPLYQCLQHAGPAGVDCTQVRAPASYVSENKVTGAAGIVASTISFQPNCKIPQACESLTITTSTTVQSSQGKALTSVASFQTRRSVSVIPSYLLVPALGFNFNCVQNQGFVIALNYGNSQAVCQALLGTLFDLSEPLANFGPLTPTTTQNMTNQNCASGFSSIGSFQDQVTCLTPTPTTLATMSPPPVATTLPMAPPPTSPTSTTLKPKKPGSLICCSDGLTGYVPNPKGAGYAEGSIVPSCGGVPNCACDASFTCCVRTNGKIVKSIPMTCM